MHIVHRLSPGATPPYSVLSHKEIYRKSLLLFPLDGCHFIFLITRSLISNYPIPDTKLPVRLFPFHLPFAITSEFYFQ